MFPIRDDNPTLGTPVVVSDIPISREIGGDAAIFFSPGDPDDLVRALGDLEADQVWRQQSARAVERAAHYTWAGSAATLLELMRRTVDELGDRGAGRRGRRRR